MNKSHASVNAEHIILVVDDDAAMRHSLKFALEVEGFKVHAYSSAHDLLKEERVPANSCLVTDYHMPAMNGLDLVAQLRARHVPIPAILITSHPSEKLRDRAAAAGISIVEKPILGNHLLDSVRAAFDGHSKPSA